MRGSRTSPPAWNRIRENLALSLQGVTVSATPGPVTLTLTAIGTLARGSALRRSGAGIGDVIYVSGTVGDGALGLKAATRRAGGARAGGLRVAGRPLPPAAAKACPWTGRCPVWPTAALDVSDGLAGDLGHIAETSGVACVVEAGRVPLCGAGARRARGRSGASRTDSDRRRRL